VDSLLSDLPDDNAAARALNLIFEELGISTPPAFKIKVSSTIPIAAGLGSGAAVTVSVIRAVSTFLGRPLPDEIVNELTFEVEKIYHGTPSGIDNTVVTYAKPVYFTKGQPIETFAVKKPFSIVIGDTGVSSPTAVTVGKVHQAWQAEPDKYDQLFEACGDVARQARQAIESGDIKKLGALMDQNQEILIEMGVSSPELNRLVSAARDAGALGAKLSGAGGGGNMIAIVETDEAQEVAGKLMEAGATNTITTVVGTR
jgi:mevalonate kinase